MFGHVRREVFGATSVPLKKHEYLTDDNTCADDSTVCIFVADAGMLGISIGLNVVSSHGACTAIFRYCCGHHMVLLIELSDTW
jgi:hypothetical protein